ncbi:serine/threonine-protein kinase [Quadrisphaera sp. INWT6]|uniref:protein kinase domain-containing protein n=1 Tax=Quadrisphaera sp. INWT6 TaxID=2596917 RepID=UPI00210751D4|nr:serine/threonine-protein kinase [Quadrisphaera sp. INWT6]
MGDALAAIHAAGVVHRDLKPGNVLVSDGEPVVIDFGIAQVADDVRLTSAGLVMGTPGYLSPEVLDGASVATSGDWWGWAATLAFAATGRPPFGRGPTEAVLSRVRRGAADLTGAPEPLVELLAAALSADPALRPPPRRLRQAVQALADGAADGAWPVPGTPTSSARTTALPARTAAPQGAPHAAPPPTGLHHRPAEGTVQLPEAAAPLAGAPPEAAPVPWPEPSGATTPDAAPTAALAAAPVERTRALPSEEPRESAGQRHAGHPADRSHDRTQAFGPTAAAPPTELHEPRSHDRTQAFGPTAAAPPTELHEPRSPYEQPRPVTRRPEPATEQLRPAGRELHLDPSHDQHHELDRHHDQRRAPEPPSPYAPIGDHDAVRADRGRPATSAVLLLLLLVAVALGAVAPLVAAMGVAVAAVLGRTVDRAVAASVRRRYERGPRRSDGAVVAFALPGQLLLAALASVPALLLPAAMALSTAFLVGWAIAPQSTPVPGQALPLAAAVLVGTVTAWWGPGSRSLRRGTRTAARGALPGRTSSLVAVAVLALLLLACVLVVVSAGGQPDWAPLVQAPFGLG